MQQTSRVPNARFNLVFLSAYCILILIGLFVTSCYWDQVPISEFSPTTISSLNETEQNALWQLKSVQMLSRCWCDFQSTPFFGYPNVTEWERDSIRAAIEAANLTQPSLPEPAEGEVLEAEQTVEPSVEDTPTTSSWLIHPFASHRMRRWYKWVDFLHGRQEPAIVAQSESSDAPVDDVEPHEGQEQSGQGPESQSSKEELPRFRRKYDLRPYGVDLIVDFGWRR